MGVLAALPLDVAQSLRCIAVALMRGGGLSVAAAVAPEPAAVAALERQVGGPVEIRVATRAFIIRAFVCMAAQARRSDPVLNSPAADAGQDTSRLLASVSR